MSLSAFYAVDGYARVCDRCLGCAIHDTNLDRGSGLRESGKQTYQCGDDPNSHCFAFGLTKITSFFEPAPGSIWIFQFVTGCSSRVTFWTSLNLDSKLMVYSPGLSGNAKFPFSSS